MCKVIQVVEVLGRAGLEQMVIRISNLTNRDKEFQVGVCVTKHIHEGRHLLDDNIPLFSLMRHQNCYVKILHLMWILIRHRVNVVHSHNWGTFFIARIATMFLGVRHIHCEHGFDSNKFSRARTMITKTLYPTVYRFVCVSDSLKKYFQNTFFGNRGNIMTIKNGVDTRVYYPREKKDIIGIPRNTVKMITVALPRPVKNMSFLIDAMSKIRELHKNHSIKCDVHLIIVGDTREGDLEKLEKQVKDLDLKEKVSLFGTRSDVAELLPACDLYINCSLSEGLSVSILEAMASGLPIIASDVGGNPEIVKDGENGYLFDVKSQDEFIKKTTQLIESPELREKYGQQSVLRVKEEFDLSNQIKVYKKIYTD